MSDECRTNYEADESELDDLAELISEAKSDPVANAAYEDRLRRFALIAAARETRIGLGKSQQAVADGMGTQQSAISELESSNSDPRLSTLQRYMRAIGHYRLDAAVVDANLPIFDETIAEEMWRLVEGQSLGPLLTALSTRQDEAGALTISQLRQVLRLPQEAVERLVENLQRDGWIKQRSQDAGLTLNESRLGVIGIHLTGREATAVLTDLGGQRVIGSQVLKLKSDSAHDVVAQVEGAVRELVRVAARSRTMILGIGANLAGLIESSTGSVKFAPDFRDAWTAFPLEGTLQHELDMKAIVENDANSLALLEQLQHGYTSNISVLVDEGVGAGIVQNGSVVHGSSDAAGEIGHHRIKESGVACRCGQTGCLETVVGREGLRARLSAAAGIESALFSDLSTSILESDRVLVEFSSAGYDVGSVLSSTVSAFDPEALAIYADSIVADQDRPSARAFDAGLRRGLSGSILTKDVEIVFRPLGPYTRALAAASVAIDEFLKRPGGWVPALKTSAVLRAPKAKLP